MLALILIAPEAGGAQALAQVQAVIHSANGQSLHTFPGRAVIASVPPSTLPKLAQLPGVAGVFTQPLDGAALAQVEPEERAAIGVWNSLLAPRPAGTSSAQSQAPEPGQPDALVAPDRPLPRPASVAATTSITPGYFQTSEFMAGSVAVGIILPESDGSREPSTENWTAEQKQVVLNKIAAALTWWAQRQPRAHLSFVYDDHATNPLPTGIEPIAHPYTSQEIWIGDALRALGYTADSYFTQVRDYNNDLRARYHTDWAFTVFVANSAQDPDGAFADHYFAYSYVGGPFLVMTYNNGSYGPSNMDAIAAHETGHIFNALDQYYSASQPCDTRSGYLNVENQNSQYGGCASNALSIMRGQVLPYTQDAVDGYAEGQIGWRDTDGDGILDPLDTQLPVSITNVLTSSAGVGGANVTLSGAATILPYPSPSESPFTINKLTGVQVRVDGGDPQAAHAGDSAFDSTTEAFHLALTVAPGVHVLDAAATDSAGNISQAPVSTTVILRDPVDGGLTTQFYPLRGAHSAGTSIVLQGAAYQLDGGRIADVQYRVNGGAWAHAQAEDGAFDSSHEPFRVTFAANLPGDYYFEAFATDTSGRQATHFASQHVTVGPRVYSLFLPLALR